MSWSIELKPLPKPKGPPVIGLFLPTRNRAAQCFSVLKAWEKFAADPAHLKILVGVDYDDEASKKLLEVHGYQTTIFGEEVITNGERARLLGERVGDCDIFLAIVDYWYPQTPNWDNNLRAIMDNNEVANLACTHEIMSFNFTAITKRWRDLANHLESPLFPFWFCDQWRLEMACFVFNKSPELQQGIATFGRHERTNNLYELDWWWGLFHSLRNLRLKQCHQIALAYGYAPADWNEYINSRRKQIDNFIALDFNRRQTIPATQQQFGDLRPMSKKYLKAKARAEQYIKDEGLEVWKMKAL